MDFGTEYPSLEDHLCLQEVEITEETGKIGSVGMVSKEGNYNSWMP